MKFEPRKSRQVRHTNFSLIAIMVPHVRRQATKFTLVFWFVANVTRRWKIDGLKISIEKTVHTHFAHVPTNLTFSPHPPVEIPVDIIYTDGSVVNSRFFGRSFGAASFFCHKYGSFAYRLESRTITPNEAEVHAALHAIKYARLKGWFKLTIFTDR